MAMRISNKILEGLIKQANRELSASADYLSMSLWFADRELPGSAAWCRAHSEEERNHGLKIFDHITKRRAKGALVQPIDHAAKFNFGQPVDVWKFALANEQTNSSAILSLVKQARDENDFVTENFMQWYVQEQLEEETAVMEILENAKRVAETNGLYVAYDTQIVTKPH
ncbi:ferritin [Fimicolochytrium jonesii]|uniref:ferritin n=1 Tax=Fimicolochytrium jonesii TaxID=1396493 RepID=UPI0022FDD1E0|nr:ferritin [Fimicolochytrium jonesii]KAI8826750.1 ferritin [Fimicolochytrium jonesii]